MQRLIFATNWYETRERNKFNLSICGFKFLPQMLVGDSYLRYQMTAAVTEQNEGCLELIIVKEACFFEA